MRLECRVLLLLLLVLAVSASEAALREGSGFGGWSPIKNVSDPHVVEIAEFAVTEYDKRSGATLKLVKVIKGDTQVVAGTNYRLVIAASNGDASAASNYEAIVWEKLWEHFRNLTSFNPVHA